ncbi:MAG: SPFH/Band 7/PHB domain protein [Deltaproteobacteria bacterium]|nr:SPFH/Band 7/PHB domain protein [Deltaproteobacteria bacterium]MBW2417323.1 SPFH/Band 7/PHB domain protein [Deltaproteobacteria bacterium]
MTVGEFLTQVFEWLYRFWPVRIVRDWEQGVRCRFGNATALLTSHNGVFGTGLHIFWPVVGEINVNETNIEVTETELQTHTTADGNPVTLSLGIKYRIRDLMSMYVSIHDPVETLSNEICSAAGRCIPEMHYKELSECLPEQIRAEIADPMEEWGIEIVGISLINLVKARPLRLILDKPQAASRFE